MSLHPTGFYQMWCFNALSIDQREHVIRRGFLPIDWRPERIQCNRGADLEVTTKHDAFPGPRFYCTACAIEFLKELMPS